MRRPTRHIAAAVVMPLAGALASPLNMAALSSRDGYSVLECWQLASVPIEAMSAANYAFGGNTMTATWSRIEPRTHVGEAWAPHVQLSIILNGLIRITSPAPAETTDGCFHGGRQQHVVVGVDRVGAARAAAARGDEREEERRRVFVQLQQQQQQQ